MTYRSNGYKPLVAALLLAITGFAAKIGDSCKYNENTVETCGDLACVPVDSTQLLNGPKGANGVCWPCESDWDQGNYCGGTSCQKNGRCFIEQPTNALEPRFFSYHLAIFGYTSTFHSEAVKFWQPHYEAGYMYKFTLGKAEVLKVVEGVPVMKTNTLYCHVGGTVNLSGADAQYLTVEAGPDLYYPQFFITSVRLSGLVTAVSIQGAETKQDGPRYGGAVAAEFFNLGYLRFGLLKRDGVPFTFNLTLDLMQGLTDELFGPFRTNAGKYVSK